MHSLQASDPLPGLRVRPNADCAVMHQVAQQLPAWPDQLREVA